MLVLSRKVGEVLMVGNVAITIVKISRDTVRVGVKAPLSVPVDRLEVRQAKESKKGSNNAQI